MLLLIDVVEDCNRNCSLFAARKSVQLYQFMLHLLDEQDDGVAWVSKEEGVFRFLKSKTVAEMWGKYKKNDNMTYESLSRALRHYYDQDILIPVPKKLHYKFCSKTLEEWNRTRESNSRIEIWEMLVENLAHVSSRLFSRRILCNRWLLNILWQGDSYRDALRSKIIKRVIAIVCQVRCLPAWHSFACFSHLAQLCFSS